ncbi:MIP family channel protein [Kribbella sp. NBC_01505]|uniref:MIP family channel protein n=1 Tax=Kribbella sp. NBC_01505 TaxID=2903580 RepID=UPI0038649D49
MTTGSRTRRTSTTTPGGEPATPVSRAYLAEFLGTAILVIGGVGTAVIAGDTVGSVGIALAFGLTLVALIYALGPISGAHFNPAVTLGLLIARRITAGKAAGYVLAQLAGGIAGAVVVSGIAHGRPGYTTADGIGANGFGAQSSGGYTLASVIGTEVVGTFVLVLVILASTDRIAHAAFAGLPIGLALTVIHLLAIPIDGTSVNPARSFGPALLAGNPALGQVWVFLAAPLIGGLLAAAAHRALFAAVPQTHR